MDIKDPTDAKKPTARRVRDVVANLYYNRIVKLANLELGKFVAGKPARAICFDQPFAEEVVVVGDALLAAYNAGLEEAAARVALQLDYVAILDLNDEHGEYARRRVREALTTVKGTIEDCRRTVPFPKDEDEA